MDINEFIRLEGDIMFSVLRISFAIISSTLACGCASPSDQAAADADSEPVVHEYRTGSLIAQKEKRATTDEERQQARDAADAIRAGARFDPTQKN